MSFASTCDIASQVAVVAFASVVVRGKADPLTADELLRIPIACAYAGVLSRLAVVYTAYLRHVHASLPPLAPASTTVADPSGTRTETTTTLSTVFHFAWPLALVSTAQKVS